MERLGEPGQQRLRHGLRQQQLLFQHIDLFADLSQVCLLPGAQPLQPALSDLLTVLMCHSVLYPPHTR
jgi:hypothetical protein